VLLGLRAPESREALLLTTLPVEGEIQGTSLADWDEKELPAPPKDWETRGDQLWDDGKDLQGARLLVPWSEGSRMWFPRQDRLWISSGGTWCLWGLQSDGWHRMDTGAGVLSAHPPQAMGRIVLEHDGSVRSLSNLDGAEWREVSAETKPWPAYDPAWFWMDEDSCTTAWDQRWSYGSGGKGLEELPPERQRAALLRSYNPDYRVASELRASVRGWLPNGPEVALREMLGVAWVWVGDRIHLVRLQPTDRVRQMKSRLRLK
jgi:hypothetical protein